MIYLIRHAQSVGNAGGRTISTKENPLSEKGLQQAKDFAEKITRKPDLIVYSPYIRTQQTAKPLIDKFPDVKVEMWNIQEFTCLDSDQCRNTLQAERTHLAKEYFSKNDPDFIHGKGAESFNQLIGRVDDMLERIKTISKDKFVTIFSHGHFMRVTLMRLENRPMTLDTFKEMRDIENTEIIEL